ncbi:hypothetical protein R1sor_012524 [Riccia sorocarpa]|uniref:Riboflavin biosynthesis protein PYRD, chloroplastic n=1 Tax=Riccia sorocarpa TaxID=122646 RepID=A0ABD3I408_9MARC
MALILPVPPVSITSLPTSICREKNLSHNRTAPYSLRNSSQVDGVRGFRERTVSRSLAGRSCGQRPLAFESLGRVRTPPLSSLCKREGVKVRCSVSTMEAQSTALPEGATSKDAEYMRMAVELARKAVGHTSPNPMVGCVIVKDGEIVGRGFHPKAGEPHAEVFALREAGKKAQGATAYVSLEPCNHTGRTPPCSQALVRARVARVVVGTVDPNPLVGGKGVETLKKAGIKVVVGVEQALCQATAETFFHRIVTSKPFLTVRYSMSLDGAALPSQGNTTSDKGSHYSRLLQEKDAVIVTDTRIREDNPRLVSAEAGAKQPLRVVIAKSLELPLDSHVFDTSAGPTLVITDAEAITKDLQNVSKQGGESMESLLILRGVDVVGMNSMNLDAVLDLLYQRGFNSVLIDSTISDVENCLGPLALSEYGPQKVVAVISPVLSGSKQQGPGLQLEDVLKLERVKTGACGGDVIVEGYVSKQPS